MYELQFWWQLNITQYSMSASGGMFYFHGHEAQNWGRESSVVLAIFFYIAHPFIGQLHMKSNSLMLCFTKLNLRQAVSRLTSQAHIHGS